jgi:hypothetical protein
LAQRRDRFGFGIGQRPAPGACQGSFVRRGSFNVRTCRAKGDIVSSGCLHDSPDRVYNNLRLVDRHDVTGFLSDRQTPSF